ncbi:hypothetical protein PUN28_010982 [Cardiocondyla obscurior]|uniref:Uncharacterized protein n=1 Tax=Cardiocondyla obscurior TaxID=286306 RepID=A0AAW2FNU7_9HYME
MINDRRKLLLHRYIFSNIESTNMFFFYKKLKFFCKFFRTTEVLLLHRPFRPSYFSKVLLLSRSLHPPRVGWKSPSRVACVTYTSRVENATPLYEVCVFVA